jgi:acyl-CoA synthetase (AMP-forming)/AMP-acid ligase II
MHTEQTANFSVRVAYDDLGLGPDDVVWMPSPVGHSTGFNYGLRFALYHGLPLVLQDAWDGDEAVALVRRERCSYTLAATTFLQDLVAASTRAGVRLDTLRCFGCGGAPVPPELVTAAGQRGIGVLRLYGSTEVLVGTWNRPGSPEAKRTGTDGTAMSHVELEVRSEDGTVCAPGEAGELFVRGPDTCVGFFDDAERTAATFDADGWVRSGDLVTIDDDGYLTVVGRKKEIIIRGGLNIAPREIEELLVGFPEVERAAVIGLPDDRLGERSCACVVLHEGAALDLEETVARLRATGLAAYKLPERLEVLDALPTTASGKVQKHEIVRRLAAQADA